MGSRSPQVPTATTSRAAITERAGDTPEWQRIFPESSVPAPVIENLVIAFSTPCKAIIEAKRDQKSPKIPEAEPRLLPFAQQRLVSERRLSEFLPPQEDHPKKLGRQYCGATVVSRRRVVGRRRPRAFQTADRCGFHPMLD